MTTLIRFFNETTEPCTFVVDGQYEYDMKKNSVKEFEGLNWAIYSESVPMYQNYPMASGTLTDTENVQIYIIKLTGPRSVEQYWQT